MIIKGLQKTTLIDYPGKVACTIFLFGCNFRCGFCHNPELVLEKNPGLFYTEEEIISFLEKRKKYLDGVCITGGEPLVSLREDFLRKIKELGFSVKLDTNGSFPERLQEFIDKNLVDYIAMDIKASRVNYSDVVNPLGKFDIESIEKSIKIISDFGNYEFRTTILYKYHDAEEIKKMMEWLKSLVEGRKMKSFYLQGFKNSGKFVDVSFSSEKNVTEEHLNSLKSVADDYFEKVGVRV